MDEWTDAGIGLDYATVALRRTTLRWLALGARLRDHVAGLFDADGRVEQIGSSSVLGLLAKPIIDLAVGLVEVNEVGHLTSRLDVDGWIYRGDAGEAGGHVFILESAPWHRVAHLHAVEFQGEQWSNYLRLRDLLRSSAEARDRYEVVKLHLAERHRNDRAAYTEGKTEIVLALLAEDRA